MTIAPPNITQGEIMWIKERLDLGGVLKPNGGVVLMPRDERNHRLAEKAGSSPTKHRGSAKPLVESLKVNKPQTSHRPVPGL
jgi:hypothetical protein